MVADSCRGTLDLSSEFDAGGVVVSIAAQHWGAEAAHPKALTADQLAGRLMMGAAVIGLTYAAHFELAPWNLTPCTQLTSTCTRLPRTRLCPYSNGKVLPCLMPSVVSFRLLGLWDYFRDKGGNHEGRSQSSAKNKCLSASRQ